MPLQILIMAAGLGSRMGAQTAEGPKALLSVNERTMGDYLVSSLKPFHPARITMVGGFFFDRLKQVMAPLHPEVEFIHNKDYEQGNLLSVMAGLESLGNADLCVLNADHLFSDAILARLFGKKDPTFANPHEGCLSVWRGETMAIACDFDRPLTDDDMKVQFGEPGILGQMKKTLSEYDAGYIGITLIPKFSLKEYQSAAKTVLSDLGPKTSAESVMNHLASLGHEIKALDASGSQWVEVDTPEDFKRAEKIIPSLNIP